MVVNTSAVTYLYIVSYATQKESRPGLCWSESSPMVQLLPMTLLEI